MIAAETPKKIWTLLDLVTWGTNYLTEKGFDDPRLNIELLLTHVLRFQRIQLYTNFDRPLSENELDMFKELLKRRLSHEPLHYILGETHFMGLKFAVDPRVLIPRPDTEILVETVINKIKKSFLPTDDIRILDIGTGSGCIAISLAKLLPNITVTAIDVSSDALDVARMNSKMNGTLEKITFLQSDVFSHRTGERMYHCIVSNPPYISNTEYELLMPEVKIFEPRTAVADGSDGLTFFGEIAKKAETILVKRGIVAVEHAYDQSEHVQRIFRESGFTNISAIKDYGGNFRCVMAEK